MSQILNRGVGEIRDEVALAVERAAPFRTRVARLLDVDRARALKALSITLLVVWVAWWVASLNRGELLSFKRTWSPVPCFGNDFYLGCDGPARVWLAGNDPYAERGLLYFIYPPTVLRVFAWCNLFSPKVTWPMWVVGLTAILSLGTWAACRARRGLGLRAIPLSTALVAVLFSTPVVFAMERGNCDSLSVLFIVAGLAIGRWKSAVPQFLSGMIMALAPWIKLYPGLLGVGLVGLRRWTALAGFVVGGLLIGALQWDEVQRFRQNSSDYIASAHQLFEAYPNASVNTWNHSLSGNWPLIWNRSPLKFLGAIDGRIATVMLLGPLLAWVTWHVWRSPERDRFAFPLLMWTVALATFVPVGANDYSLVFLPLAAIAVWDRRAPLLVQAAMIGLVLWWQPLGLPINGRLLLVMKVVGMAAVGVCLAERAAATRSGHEANPEPQLAPE